MMEIHRDLGTGTRSLQSLENQLLYGKIMLNEALRNMQTARFGESIRVGGGGEVAPPTQAAEGATLE